MSALTDRFSLPLLRLARRVAAAPFAALHLPAADEALAGWWMDPEPADALRIWLEALAREAPAAPQQIADAGADVPVREAAESAGVKAYALVPVPVQDGRQPQGLLIVSDTKPRPWTDEQLAGLQEVAAAIEREVRLSRQIAEREAAAREFHDLLERASEMIVSVQVGGRVLFVNEALRRALGYEAEELIGRQATDFVAPEYRAIYREAAARIIREGVIRGIEVELITRDGSRIVLACSGNCRYVDGEPVATRLFLRDITEQKRIEEDVALISSVAQAIGRGKRLADGVPGGLELLAQHGGWARAELWLAMEAGDRPTRIARWPEDQSESGVTAEEIGETVRRAIEAQRLVQSDSSLTVALPFGNADSAPGALVLQHTSAIPPDEIPFLKTAIGHLAPIIERRRAKSVLVRSRTQLAEFLDNVRDMVVTVGPTGYIRYANRAWRETMGYVDVDLSGLTMLEMLPPEHRASAVEDMQRVLHESAETPVDVALIARDGQPVHVEGVIRPYLQRDGELALAGIFSDVSRRREAERELHKTEEQLRAILRTVQEGILVLDINGKPLYGNPAAARILRLTPGSTGDAFYETPDWRIEGKHPGEYLRHDRSFAAIMSAGEPIVGVERTLEHPDGTRSIISFNAAPLHEEDDGIAGLVLSFQDITGQKEFVKQLRERGRQLADAQMIGGIGSWEWDLVSEEITWSDYLYKMFGLPPGTPVRLETFLHFVVPADRRRVRTELQASLRRQIPIAFEFEVLTTSGELRALYARGDVVRDPHGQPIRVTGITQDITQQRQRDEELRQARDAAHEAARAKSEFLANMSHEIRTPLTGIMGMTDLLLDTEITSEQRQYLEMVRSSGGALLQIIDDILDVSKVEAGKLTLDSQPFPLRTSLTHLAQQLGVQAADKGLELALHIAPDVPDWIVADQGRMRQILVNLIGNAIKFTSEGEVVVEVEVDTASGDDELLHLQVRDTGIGIPSAMQARIFAPFTQGDSSTTRRFGGTGLGLSITAQLVRLMGGQIRLESEEGAGSAFHVLVPLVRMEAESGAESEPAVVRARRASSFAQLRVLIVDESVTTRDIVREMLKSWGVREVEATSGRAGLARQLGAGRGFHLCIVGCSIQGGIDLEMVEQIRAAGAEIVVLTGSIADRVAVARAGEMEIHHVLPKPIDSSQLFNAIQAVVSAQQVKAPAGELADDLAGEEKRSLHVLVAEDNVVNQRYVEALLTRAGHSVEIVGDGQTAVERAFAGDFDVVLMDLQMPELGGLEATELIRAEEARTGGHLPIIALTAHALQDDKDRCLAAGMDDYLSKPFTGQQLLEKLEAVLSPARPASAGQGRSRSTAAAEFIALLGSEETLLAVGAAFLEHANPTLQKLRQAVADRDAAAARLAHTLRGSTSILGAEAAVSILRQIEEAARQERWAEADQAVVNLEREMEELQTRVRQSMAEVARGGAL